MLKIQPQEKVSLAWKLFLPTTCLHDFGSCDDDANVCIDL